MININSGKFPSYAQNLGVDFLAYILNEDSEFIQSLLSEGGSLNTDKHAVLLEVDNFIKENKRHCVNDTVLTYSDRVNLSQARCQNGTLAVNQYRIFCGGDFEEIQSDDLVKKVLAKMCVDWFPFTLLPTSNEIWITGLEFPSFYGTSFEKDFIHAVEADSVIMKLFPDYSRNIMERSCQYYTSIGQSGGIHITTLHSQLLRASHALMDVKGAISLGDFQRCAGSMVDCLRAALSGEQCGIPLIHVFDLVGLPNDFSEDTAIGIVRCLPKSFEKHIPKGARPARGIQYASILERKADYSISLAPKDDDKNLYDGWPIPFSTQLLDCADERFALISSFALGEEEATAARPRARLTICPLQGVGVVYSSDTFSLGGDVVANKHQCLEIVEYAKIIGNIDYENINLAVRRFLRATMHRQNVEDSLIDAIIGLENLFGQRTEIAFSVASSVAVLLSDNIEDRYKIFEDVKKSYNARSAFVHGDKNQIAKLDLPKIRQSALCYLKKCLIELFKNRHELIVLDASERSKTLVLV